MRLLLLDNVTSINENSIAAEKYLTINEDIYEYHFPKNPVLPAAFMVEASVQLSRVLLWKKFDFMFTSIPLRFSKFKFNKILSPGSIMKINMDIISPTNEIKLHEELKFRVKGISEDMPVFEGTFVCKIMLFNEFHNERACRDYLSFICKGIAK